MLQDAEGEEKDAGDVRKHEQPPAGELVIPAVVADLGPTAG